MKKILIVTLLMVLVFGSILAITGVIGAEEPIVITEEDFEMDCMAAPAVAGILLEEAGIDNRYGKGKDGGNYISDVARHMGPETDFNGVKKCDIIAYECVIAAYLNGLENFPGVTSQYTGILDPVASGATWEDNKDKTGTMYLTVLDKCGNSIEGLGLADIEVDITWVGLTDLFTLGAGGYWNIDLVDESDGNYEITFYRLGSVPYSRNWDIIIMDEVIEKSLYVTVTDVSAVLESVVYEGTCSLFGTHIGDKITFTFSNNVFHESNVEVTFQTAQRLWEGWGADDWTMDGNTATVTLKRLYSSPRDIIGDTVIDISGMVDALDNLVIVPSGGVEVIAGDLLCEYKNLILENKNPSTWEIIHDDRSGEMSYCACEDFENKDFIFKGYGLDYHREYTLISYKEATSGPGSNVLGQGITDEWGYVQFNGECNFIYYDYTEGEYKDQTGAKIWLVPKNRLTFNLDGTVKTIAWLYMSEFLWETELILQ